MATLISGLGGTAGYGEQSFRTSSYTGNLDDGYTSIDLTSIFGSTGMNFNGTSYTSMYLGTNGLATFNSGVTTYSPTTLTSLNQPVLAPFWTDIDINKGGEIYWDFDTANNRLIVTWLNVAPYSGSGTNSFQMVLTSTGAGDFNVDYIYQSIGFTNGYAGVAQVGIASGGTATTAEGSGNAALLSTYPGNDFDTNDPLGVWSLSYEGGAQFLGDGIVDGTAGNDLIDVNYLGDAHGDRIDAQDATGYNGTTGQDDYVLAGAGNDTVQAGLGNDVVYGGSGNDQIFGGTGNDWADGGTENDSIDGGSGNDTLYGGAGDDTLYGGDGNDLAYGGNGNDTIYGDAGNDTLSGDDGNDTVYGGIGNDVIFGGAGDDSVFGDDGADTISGGTGNDTVYGGAGDDNVLSGGGNDVLYGDAGNDLIYDDAGNSTLYGGTGNDQAWGFAGDDLLFGGDGNDTLYGGIGNDALYGDAGADTLYGDDGNDILSGGDGADSLSGDAGNDLLSGDAGSDTLSGGDGNDSLYGGTESDTLYGDAGDDVLYGGSGNDSLEGGVGNDSLYGGSGDDTLWSGDGDDLVSGGDGNDAISTGNGNDTILGDLGADTINASQGMDWVDYSASNAGVTVDLTSGTGAGGYAAGDVLLGVDALIGSAYDDVLLGYDGSSANPADPFTNVFFGNGGNDYIDGRGGDDSLYGGADNDTILGGAGNDLIDGGSGNDLIYGGAGADTIDGGTGNDTIVIGAGSDGFGDVVAGGENSGDYDVLDLTAWGWALTNILYDPLNPENGTVQFLDGAGAVIGSMTFTGIEKVIPCFTPGTRITTARGEVAVEDLRAGDLVVTRDNGVQEIRWVGQRDLSIADLIVQPALRPVEISAGALGHGLPLRDMQVSPQHRMLIEGARAEMLFGEAEVLVAATHLQALPGIATRLTRGVRYIHLLFDRHEIICANGAWTESFQPAMQMLDGMEDAQRTEIAAIFPEITAEGFEYPAARLTLKAHEARVLLQA